MFSPVTRPLVVSLLGLALFGGGCSKSLGTQQAAPKPVAKPSSNPSVLLFPAAAKPSLTVNEELQQILENFRKANSLRTTFEMSTESGQVKGEFSFIRPNRFKGTMTAKDGSFDIVVVDDSLFIKAPEKGWMNLSNQTASKSLTDTLRKAMSGNSTFDAAGAGSTALVTKTHDDARSCDAYKTTAKAADGSLVSITVCAENQLPKFVDMTTNQGPVRISYYDYNQLFLIEKPRN